jgi:hypothetical protein
LSTEQNALIANTNGPAEKDMAPQITVQDAVAKKFHPHQCQVNKKRIATVVGVFGSQSTVLCDPNYETKPL